MIYIASPLFSVMERNFIDNIVNVISERLVLNLRNDFYIPHRDSDYTDSEILIYDENIKNLNECDIMVAVLDGGDIDSGTAFEIGYFTSQNKIVLGLLTDKRSYNEEGDLNTKLNTMVFGTCGYGVLVFSDIDDLINELYYILCED